MSVIFSLAETYERYEGLEVINMFLNSDSTLNLPLLCQIFAENVCTAAGHYKCNTVWYLLYTVHLLLYKMPRNY